jgi:hypothetical protein
LIDLFWLRILSLTTIDPNISHKHTGLAFYSPWGSNRYTANTALIALMAAEYGLNPEEYRGWAKKQVDYILAAGGDINPATGKPKFSYLIGFGDDYPRAPHHRSSSCDGDACDCSKKPHPHVLYGALVGGPGDKDDFVDDCTNFQHNEVAIDYVRAWVIGMRCLLCYLLSSCVAYLHYTNINTHTSTERRPRRERRGLAPPDADEPAGLGVN